MLTDTVLNIQLKAEHRAVYLIVNDHGYSWFGTTRQGGHVGGPYNNFFSKNLHENGVYFPEERNAFVFDH